jgi:hypothetical protein
MAAILGAFRRLSVGCDGPWEDRMKSLANSARLIALIALVAMPISLPSAAQADGLDIQVVDGQISIDAEAVALGRLLKFFDRVAGTESTVPTELENRNVSVQFHALDLAHAVKKIFEGLPLDYVVLEHGRIVVTAVAGTLTAGAGGVPVPANNTVQASRQPFAVEEPPVAAANPFQSPGVNLAASANGVGGTAPAQPAIIQTPFGPLVNPRANAQSTMPLAGPGQGFPLGAGAGSVAPPVTTDGRVVFPTSSGLLANGTQPGATPPALFGNTSPAILDLKNAPPAFPNSSQP